jgi:hypothetical protein
MLFYIRNTLIYYLIFIILLIIVVACSDNSTDPSDKEFVLPDSNLSFQEHIGPLLLAKCASQNGCHSTVDQKGGLDLTNYQDILTHIVDNTDAGPVRLVEPGNAIGSFLYPILLDNYLGKAQMPLDGPYLNANNTNGVRVWIDEGALYLTD